MAKSLVLKDEKNRPGGYVIAAARGILCRAQMDRPSLLMLHLTDGTWKSHQLMGCAEQAVPVDAEEFCEACVVCDGHVVLASGEAARVSCTMEIEREVQKQTPSAVAASVSKEREIKQDSKNRSLEKKEEYTSIHSIFAQRRWPPPPCWESACYVRGCWQEETLDDK